MTTPTRRIASMDQIEALNSVAQGYQEDHPDEDGTVDYGDPTEALAFAVTFAGLERVADTSVYGLQAEHVLYRFPAGELVNCDILGTDTGPIGSDGGPGFDDQIDGYSEDEEEDEVT